MKARCKLILLKGVHSLAWRAEQGFVLPTYRVPWPGLVGSGSARRVCTPFYPAIPNTVRIFCSISSVRPLTK